MNIHSTPLTDIVATIVVLIAIPAFIRHVIVSSADAHESKIAELKRRSARPQMSRFHPDHPDNQPHDES